MTAYSDIEQFASGSSANVTSLATYQANTGLLANGYADGEIPLAQDWNRAMRQSSFVSAGVAAWLVSHGISVPDDSNLSALAANIDAAITSIATNTDTAKFATIDAEIAAIDAAISADTANFAAINAEITALTALLGTKITRFTHVTSGLTYTPTSSFIVLTGCGGAGGGSGGSPTSYSFSGAGGSAGASDIRRVLACTPGATLNIVLGRGGTGGAVDAAGGDGTATTISGLPAQADVVGGVYTFSGGLGGHAVDGIGYCAGGASVGGIGNDQGKAGGYGIGAIPGAGGGSSFSPTSNPYIGTYPGTDDYANGNGGRGSGGAGGYIGYGGENGGSGFLQIEETQIRS